MSNPIAFKCPICDNSLTKDGSSYACENKHSFDIAKEGYVNLLPVQQKSSKNPGDSYEMIKSRQEFLEKGYYENLAKTLVTTIISLNPRSLLDSGCGEGYYLQKLRHELTEATLFGIDVSKEAIRFAAKRKLDVQLAVASAYQLPFFNGSFDVVISIFSPISTNELARVLKPDGRVIIVGPGPDHLKGLAIQLFRSAIPHEGNFSLLDSDPRFNLVTEQEVRGEITVAQKDISNLLGMTPYYWRTTPEHKQQLLEISELKAPLQFHIKGYSKSPA